MSSKQAWRKTKEYRMWKVAVVKRDKVCQCCGSKQNRHAHHIKHATYSPELRFDVDNGITLCKDCHMIVHNKIAGGYRIKCGAKHVDRLLYIRGFWCEQDYKDLKEASKKSAEEKDV